MLKVLLKRRIFTLLTIFSFSIYLNPIFAQDSSDDSDYDDDEDQYTLNIYILNEGSVRVFEGGSADEGGSGQEYCDQETIPADLSSLHLFVKPDDGMTLDMLLYNDGSEEYMEWEGEGEIVTAPGWEGWLYLGNDITPSGDVSINAVFATDLVLSSIPTIEYEYLDSDSKSHQLYNINGTPCQSSNPAPGYYITVDNGTVRKVLIK